VSWLGRELAQSDAKWKICVLHHPLYSPGRYRTQARLYRWRLESLLVQHGVDAVFSGHEHFYARSVPQGGILYFISGAAGSLRRGEAAPAADIARSFDRDFHFMLVEIDGDELHFQAIARDGRTVDAGSLRQPGR
jgi:3',5'-cyclic AMP phosphodiesterase CpdA